MLSAGGKLDGCGRIWRQVPGRGLSGAYDPMKVDPQPAKNLHAYSYKRNCEQPDPKHGKTEWRDGELPDSDSERRRELAQRTILPRGKLADCDIPFRELADSDNPFRDARLAG
jgi:hypothetical protein